MGFDEICYLMCEISSGCLVCGSSMQQLDELEMRVTAFQEVYFGRVMASVFTSSPSL